jgi:hypothetical protein
MISAPCRKIYYSTTQSGLAADKFQKPSSFLLNRTRTSRYNTQVKKGSRDAGLHRQGCYYENIACESGLAHYLLEFKERIAFYLQESDFAAAGSLDRCVYAA